MRCDHNAHTLEQLVGIIIANPAPEKDKVPVNGTG